MVLIKTKKTVCLEENTGLADVLDDAGKKKERQPSHYRHTFWQMVF